MTLNVYIPDTMKTMFKEVTDVEGVTDALTRSLFSALVGELKQLSLDNHDLVDDEIKQKLSSKEDINQLIGQTYYYLYLALRNDRESIRKSFDNEDSIKSISIAMINIMHILSNDGLKAKVSNAFEDYDCSTSELEEILKIAKVEFNALTKARS